MIYAHIQSTDSWKHISHAEEVEVHAVLGSESGAGGGREGEDQRGLC